MENHHIACIFFMTSILVIVAENACAQQINDEFKRHLKQSLITNDPNPKSEFKHQPIVQPQDEKDKLKVSPTTRLPTRLDKIQLLEPVSPEERVNIHLIVTNRKDSMVLGKRYYSIKGVPESVRYMGGDGGASVGVSVTVGDFDPIRTIQRRKQRERQKKIDKIKQVYGQD